MRDVRLNSSLFFIVMATLAVRSAPAISVSEGPVVKVGLKQCLQRALQHNREIKAQGYDVDIAVEKLNEARTVGFPVFEYEYNLAPVPQDVDNAVESLFSGDVTVFNRLKVGIGTPLTTFGKIEKAKELAGYGIEAAQFQREAKQGEIVAKVQQLYYAVLLSHELDRLLDFAQEKLGSEINKREESGEGDPSELLRLKIFFFDIVKKKTESEKKRELGVQALKALLGYGPSVRLEFTEKKLRPIESQLGDWEAYEKEFIENRPQLLLAEVGLEVKRAQWELEKRKWTPNLGVGAFFEIGRAPGVTGVTATDDFNDPFNFNQAGVGLRLKGDFDFHKYFSRTRQAESELKKIEIQRELAEKGMNLDLRQTYLDLQETWQDLEREEEAGRLSRQLLFLTQSNFDLGLAESKDLVDAVQSFLTSRGKYFEAVYNYNAAYAALEQKLGRIPDGVAP